MPRFPASLMLCVLSCAMPVVAGALELREVQVVGLADEEMHDNVDDALSLQRLNPNRRKSLSESRLAYLLRRAPGEARRALEPFGHYDPAVETDVRRDGDIVDVVVNVDIGEPVRVTTRDLALRGPAATDSALMRRLPHVAESCSTAATVAKRSATCRSSASRLSRSAGSSAITIVRAKKLSTGPCRAASRLSVPT
jgi:outer membrane translocation and assembly module TamA